MVGYVFFLAGLSSLPWFTVCLSKLIHSRGIASLRNVCIRKGLFGGSDGLHFRVHSILKDPGENIAKDVATPMYVGGADIVCVLFPCVNNSSDVFQMVSRTTPIQ